jgi:hypothetical protein
MFAGLRRAVGAKRGRGLVLLKSAPKPENKTYNHFTPIKGQASARQRAKHEDLRNKTALI